MPSSPLTLLPLPLPTIAVPSAAVATSSDAIISITTVFIPFRHSYITIQSSSQEENSFGNHHYFICPVNLSYSFSYTFFLSSKLFHLIKRASIHHYLVGVAFTIHVTMTMYIRKDGACFRAILVHNLIIVIICFFCVFLSGLNRIHSNSLGTFNSAEPVSLLMGGFFVKLVWFFNSRVTFYYWWYHNHHWNTDTDNNPTPTWELLLVCQQIKKHSY